MLLTWWLIVFIFDPSDRWVNRIQKLGGCVFISFGSLKGCSLKTTCCIFFSAFLNQLLNHVLSLKGALAHMKFENKYFLNQMQSEFSCCFSISMTISELVLIDSLLLFQIFLHFFSFKNSLRRKTD